MSIATTPSQGFAVDSDVVKLDKTLISARTRSESDLHAYTQSQLLSKSDPSKLSITQGQGFSSAVEVLAKTLLALLENKRYQAAALKLWPTRRRS